MSYYWEPFPFIVYPDVKSRIADDMSDADVAALYADVSNKIGGLLHHADDPDYRSQWDVIDQSLAMWEELEDLLFNKIVGILGHENESGSHHVLSGIGTHYIVLPFMERNSFLDGSGWWIPDQGKELQV